MKINSMLLTALLTLGLGLAFSDPAIAYGGPGTALGVVVMVLSIIGTLLLAIFGIFYYPIKRWIKSRNAEEPTEDIKE